MKQILFPINKSLPFETSGSNGEPRRRSSISWKALDPLQMAERIAQMAGPMQNIQRKTTLSQRRGQAPLQINTEFLAQELPDVPTAPRNAVGSIPPAIVTKVNEAYDASQKKPCAMPPVDGKKRSFDASPSLPPLPPLLIRTTQDPEVSLAPWDFTFLVVHNPDDATAKMAVCTLTNISRKLESMPMYEDCRSSYQRFRDGLYEKSRHIFQTRSIIRETSNAFAQLYSTAINQMKSLVIMAQEIENENRMKVEAMEELHFAPPTPKRVYNKKQFAGYMSQWLVENWTNPYPDEQGLQELAESNGTTTTVVANWLINARTRKWRPAIVQAYESDRPADFLLEDSINIYFGNDLREL